MDSDYYNDLRAPFMTVSPAAVTLSTTLKALYTVADVPAMGKDYWWAGKTVRLRVFGKYTTGATPGNLTLQLNYGTGADANGTNLAFLGNGVALTANQTTLSWQTELTIRCITTGATGTLFATGTFFRTSISTTVVAANVPNSGPTAGASVDLTVAGNILSLQASRDGSTGETMQVVDLQVIALN